MIRGKNAARPLKFQNFSFCAVLKCIIYFRVFNLCPCQLLQVGLGGIKCFIFQQNNVKIYEIYHNCILS